MNPADTTTRDDRALAHAHYFKLRDGMADDWIEGRLTDEAAGMDDDVCALAVAFAKVRRESAAPELARALPESQAALAAVNARIQSMTAPPLTGDDMLPLPTGPRGSEAAVAHAMSGMPKVGRTSIDIHVYDYLRAEVNALRADLARVTGERDDLAKRAFNLADEAEQAQDCGEAQSSECCGECIACRDVTLRDTVGKYDAARAEAETLRRERDEARAGLTEAEKPTWACTGCGAHGDRFSEVRYLAGDADVQCNACGSKDTFEIERVLEQVIEERATAREAVREMVDGLRDVHTHINRVGWLNSSDLAVDARIRALLAKHAAPAPTPADAKETPAAVPGLVFGEPDAAGKRTATAGAAKYTVSASRSFGGRPFWFWGGPGMDRYDYVSTESEAIAAANAHNAARLAKKGGE